MIWNLVSPGVPIDLNDRINVSGFTQVAALKLYVRIKTILPDGQVQSHQHIVETTGDGTEDTFEFRIDGGYLIGVSIGFTTGALSEVEGFFVITLRRAELGNAGPYVLLTSGYVGIGQNISWPESLPVKTHDIEGVSVLVTVANPAAGANWSHTIPDGTCLLIKAVRFRFVTAVAVATRRVRLEMLSGANIIHQMQSANTQVASVTDDYNFSHNSAAQILTDNIHNISIPEIRLIGGNTLRVQTANIAAADQFSAIVILGYRRGQYV